MADFDPCELHSDPLRSELRSLAERAARAGGAVARDMFETDLQVSFKPDGSEVSNADRAAQDAVINVLRESRPNDCFIAEEASEQPLRATGAADAVYWAIDPIDGTRNYVRGIPFFTCSVGALIGGTPVAGAVFDPLRDCMYAAAVGQGMFVNGCRRTVRDGDERTLVAAIPSKRHKQVSQLVHTWVDRLVVRNTGSTALHLAMVAAGQLDAALASNAALWDIAAGYALIVAAGGVATLPDGHPIFPVEASTAAALTTDVLAAGPLTHARLIRTP